MGWGRADKRAGSRWICCSTGAAMAAGGSVRLLLWWWWWDASEVRWAFTCECQLPRPRGVRLCAAKGHLTSCSLLPK